MNSAQDKFLVTWGGEVLATHKDFDVALKDATKRAKEMGVTVSIDIVEQRLVSSVTHHGYVMGRKE